VDPCGRHQRGPGDALDDYAGPQSMPMYARAAVVAAGKREAGGAEDPRAGKQQKQSDSGDAATTPGKEALPAVDIANACSATAIL